MIPGLLWTRDGHLLDLALHQHRDGDLPEGVAAEVAAHLASCTQCAARLDEQTQLASAPLPPLKLPGLTVLPSPPPRSPEPVEEPEAPVAEEPEAPVAEEPEEHVAEVVSLDSRRRWWRAGGAVLAMAAGLLITVRVILPGPNDSWQSRSDALSLSVYRQQAGEAILLGAADTLSPGDELAFMISSRDAGHLALIGLDGSDSTYRIYPQTGDAVAIEAARSGMELGTGIRIDDTPGEERITAILCEQPLTWEAAEAELRAPSREDCTQKELRLKKTIP